MSNAVRHITVALMALALFAAVASSTQAAQLAQAAPSPITQAETPATADPISPTLLALACSVAALICVGVRNRKPRTNSVKTLRYRFTPGVHAQKLQS
jgi:hypothetical protein